MGVDYGTKRVGVALSDEGGTMAFPCAILENGKGLVGEIKNICIKGGVGQIVVGESLNYKSEPNRVMKEINNFVAELWEAIGVPVVFEREFLSTQQARFFQEKKKHVDDSAAAVILQSYLDRKHNKSILETLDRTRI
jgi:putative Holliday junction resolvase